MTSPLRRSFIASLLALSLFALPAAAGFWLVWDENPEPDIVNYHVHYGVVGESGTNIVTVVTNGWSLETLERGRYYWFFVTAENNAGLVSDPSEILLSSLPGSVTGSRLTNQPAITEPPE